jgi:predicted dinucleotide-binding enzyme
LKLLATGPPVKDLTSSASDVNVSLRHGSALVASMAILPANLNFAVLHDQIAAQRVPPGSFYVAEDGARDITGQLSTDAGYDPVPPGGLDKARAVEDLAWLLVAAMNDGAPVFHRFAVAGGL